MPSATKLPEGDQFRPRVIDGALAAADLDELMAVAGLFAGYDSMTAEAGGDGASASIWDDAMDMRFACR